MHRGQLAFGVGSQRLAQRAGAAEDVLTGVNELANIPHSGTGPNYPRGGHTQTESY